MKSLDGSSDKNNFFLPCGLIAKSYFNGIQPLARSHSRSLELGRCLSAAGPRAVHTLGWLADLEHHPPLPDTFALRYPNNKLVPLKKKGIAWSSDLDHKFKNPGSDVPGIR